MSFLDDDDWRAGEAERAASIAPSAGTSAAGTSGTRAFLARLGSVAEGVGLGSEAGEGASEGVGGEEGEEVFSAAALDPGPPEGELDELRRLARAATRERGTPAILPWDGDLLDTLLDKLEQQGKMIATLREDPTTSEEEHFRLVLVQTEMERAKFLVRVYVRTRLWKAARKQAWSLLQPTLFVLHQESPVPRMRSLTPRLWGNHLCQIEKFAQHITETPELHSRLSGAELEHARRYSELLATHYSGSVLDSLPEWLGRLDDTHNGVSMVVKPNLETPVLVYCRRDCGSITLEDGSEAVLGVGTSHLVKYGLVERWIDLGWAEVL